MALGISRHCSYCTFEDRSIILDLRAGRYFGVSGRADRALRQVASGDARDACGIDELGDLIRRGILVEGIGRSEFRPPSTARASISVLDDDGAFGAWILPAVANQLIARLLLRLLPLHVVIGWIERRKRYAGRFDTSLGLDTERNVAKACQVARRLTAARDQCLVSSISLVNLLATREIFPDLVFGVKPAPFEAHCWVQSGSRVLNDTVENVGLYTPIRVV